MRRLEAIAGAVPDNASGVADIGYDHGLLLALLGRRQNPPPLIGVERLKDAHQRFRAAFPDLGHVDLRMGSGLGPLSAKDRVSVVVIAGMGEHRIAELLSEAAPSVLRVVERLVLCPADFRHVLRPWLAANGWRAAEDDVVYERGRAYEVMAYERQAIARGAEGTARFFGTLSGDELLAYCQHLCERHRGALAAPASARSPLLDKLRAAQRHIAQSRQCPT